MTTTETETLHSLRNRGSAQARLETCCSTNARHRSVPPCVPRSAHIRATKRTLGACGPEMKKPPTRGRAHGGLRESGRRQMTTATDRVTGPILRLASNLTITGLLLLLLAHVASVRGLSLLAGSSRSVRRGNAPVRHFWACAHGPPFSEAGAVYHRFNLLARGIDRFGLRHDRSTLRRGSFF
jgi:hypothetical protein